MAKVALSPDQAEELRQNLQVLVLQALVAARRWEPGDLIFQGGTSLHLCHGSPRFSEDLDFLLRSTIDPTPLASAIAGRLRLAALPLPARAQLSVTPARDGKNPHTFAVAASGPGLHGSVRVKVKLWRAAEAALKPLHVQVQPVRLLSGPGAGAQTFVPAASLRELFADKVFALAARPFLKARDVFDLHWMKERDPELVCTAAALRLRLATYPSATPSAWLASATERAAALPAAQEDIARDLARWLPSYWPLSATTVGAMSACAVAALRHGMDEMGTLLPKIDVPVGA